MSISIKKNIKPTFENVEMLCDKPLSKSLSKYDLTNFLNFSLTLVFSNSEQPDRVANGKLANEVSKKQEQFFILI
jgi:hypothetical protein